MEESSTSVSERTLTSSSASAIHSFRLFL